MLQISQGKNLMIIKGEPMFIGMGIVTVFMSFTGFRVLFEMIYGFFSGAEYTVTDFVGFVFMCFWVTVVLCMSFYSFKTGSKQITINNDGVLCKTWLDKKLVKWTDIKDWGLSYCGQTRGEGNTYYLYFSEHECDIKNEYRKKLKGKMIKTCIFESDYNEAVSKILPFCCERTNTVPFVSENKYHFI